jgi:hypothetical protein
MPAKRTCGEWTVMTDFLWGSAYWMCALVGFWFFLSITVKVIVVSAITAAHHANQYLTKESSSGDAT